MPNLIGFLSYAAGYGVLSRRRGAEAHFLIPSFFFGVGLSSFFSFGIINWPIQVFMMDAFQGMAKICGVIIAACGIYYLASSGPHRTPNAHVTLGPVFTRFLGALAVGASFGAVWPHCLSPILEGLVNVSLTPESSARGTALLIVYAAGLSTSFAFAGLMLDKFAGPLFNRVDAEGLMAVLKGSGSALIGLGVWVFLTVRWLMLSRVLIGLANNSPNFALEQVLLSLMGTS